MTDWTAPPAAAETPTQQLARVCHRLYERRLVTSVAGNVSVRQGDRVLITPTGLALDEVAPEDVVVTDLHGQVIEGRHRPSSELPMHLALFRANPLLGAVVHTHSAVATAFAVTGRDLAAITTEAEMLLGHVPLVSYAPPGSPELGEAVARFAGEYRGAILERHGVVAWGDCLRTAYHRAELVEETARVHLLVDLLGARAGGAGTGSPGRGTGFCC